MITCIDGYPGQGMTLFTCPCAGASLTAKRMSHGVQPWPVVRGQAEGMSQVCAVGLLAGVERAEGRRSLRRPSEGRAQRGLNLLLTHFTTDAYEAFQRCPS